jgi:hypothetical protein
MTRLPTVKDRWADVVRQLDIDLSQPVSPPIRFADLERASGKQSRIMMSMDHSGALPPIFLPYSNFPVAISTKEFRLVRGAGFHRLESISREAEIFPARVPRSIAMLGSGTAEGKFVLHALNSGLIERVTGLEGLYPVRTGGGRERTGEFDFHLDGFPSVSVNGAQIEVDLALSCPSTLVIFEAKATQHDDFLVRQLYYPYRHFQEIEKSGLNRPVKTFFFRANPASDMYTFWEYHWMDDTDYESIRFRRAWRFEIEEAPPPTTELLAVAPETPSVNSERAHRTAARSMTIPQANSIQRIADLPLLIERGVRSASQWSAICGKSPRQGQYYRRAAQLIGLVASGGGDWKLTTIGRNYVARDPPGRAEMLAKLLLRAPVMHQTLHDAVLHGESGLSFDQITNLVAEVGGLQGKTRARRASTILAWFKWIQDTTGAVAIRDRHLIVRSPSTH